MTAEPAARDRRADFARTWAGALYGVGYVALTRAEQEHALAGLAAKLGQAMLAEPVDTGGAYQVGGELVAKGFAGPEMLGRTVTLICSRFAADLGLADGPATAARVAALVEALVAGFTSGVHDRALDAQETVRLAALIARSRAERALRTSEARSRHLATHDPLTDLPNWSSFADQLDEALRTAGPGARLGVICVGLDGFAAVNHSLGHRVGDRLLVAAAQRLRGVAAAPGGIPAGVGERGRGHLVARLDSDQFAVLVEGTTSDEDAGKVADRMLSALSEPFQVDDNEVPLTASAGVVEGPAARGDPAELIRAAQVALHWAKADGRARWRLFHPGRSAEDAARYRLSAAMPAALRRGEFTLAYQPLVDLTDGRLDGVEALVRWRHPEHGLLGAESFIGLAVDAGLIVPLGQHLLELACQQGAAWQAAVAHPPYVSVNLAVRQLHHPGLVGSIAQILDRTGLPPRRLQLEVTEHAAIATDPEVVVTLAALANLGVRVVIDDFGTGHSNLACLNTLPLHGLKLDASFVRTPARPGRPGTRPDGFLATVVSLGHQLGLTVTAEGIETATQAARMRAAGCDLGQGWHYGMPSSAAEVTRQLAPRSTLLP